MQLILDAPNHKSLHPKLLHSSMKTDVEFQSESGEKPLGIEIKIPIHKRLEIDIFKGKAQRTFFESDRVKRICIIRKNSVIKNI